MDILVSKDFRYLIGTFLFLAVWVIMYVFTPKSRPPMLWSSIVLMATVPVLDFLYTFDYWHPQSCLAFSLNLTGDATMNFAVEGFIFGFAFSGICVGIFDWGMRLRGHDTRWEFNWASYGRLWPTVLGAVVTILSIHFVFGLNTVHAHCIGCAVLSVLYLWRIQSNWVIPSLITGGGMIFIMGVIYFCILFRIFPSFVEDAWKLDNLMGINLLGVPLEEFLWAGASGLYIGAAVCYCGESHPEETAI